MMAANEELQSTNEELQSVNEELYTVNSEYQQKIVELTDINNDLENLMIATHLAVLFLNSDLKIRRFTHAMKQYVNIIDFDINRDFRDLSFKKPLTALDELVSQVNRGQKSTVKEVYQDDSTAQRYEVTVSQYKIGDSAKGVIISIVELHQ